MEKLNLVDFNPIFLDVVHSVAADLQVSYEMVATTMLYPISLATQDILAVEMPNRVVTPTNLSLILAASSGERKSALINKFLHPIREKHIELEKSNKTLESIKKAEKILLLAKKKELIKFSKRGELNNKLIHELAGIEENLSKSARCERILYDDATIEALMYAKSRSSYGGIWLSQEASTIINQLTLSTCNNLCKLWDGDDITYDRKNAESFNIKDSRLTVLFALQTELLESILDKKLSILKDSGLLARFLICVAEPRLEPRVVNFESVVNQRLDVFNQRVKKVLDSALLLKSENITTTLKFDNSAARYWLDFASYCETIGTQHGSHGDVSGFVSKLANQVARIAANIHYFTYADLENSNKCFPINYESIEMAISFGYYFLSQAKLVYGEPSLERIACGFANELALWLSKRQNPPGCASRSEILKYGPRSIRSKENLDLAFGFLIYHNLAAVYSAGKKEYIQLIRLS